MREKALKKRVVTPAMLLVTIGVVYGDIGTSPMYVLKSIIENNGGLQTVNRAFIIGSLSLIIWTVTLITTVKYVVVAMKADNNGEGGIFALYSLVKNYGKYLVIPAMLGGAALLADGVLTPAVTITTAIEGLHSISVFDQLLNTDQNRVILITLIIIYAGVRNGIERVSKFMMPILIVLSLIITIYSVTRPGAMEGVKYFLVPNLKNFSWMSVVAAMGQMFYSLSIAMGILITFGSYMKKDISIEDSTRNVEVFDTAIAIMAGLMIIPAVFAFSGGNPDTLQAGPALMFITIPKVFENMGLGTAIGILFFLLVLFAALTSSIALTESAVSTFEDEIGWSRKKSTVLVGVIMIVLGSLSSLGYGPLAFVKIIGMQFLDFFDFLTNSVMMPIAALMTSLLVARVVGVKKIEEEIIHGENAFRRKKIFAVMIKYLCPIFVLIILISSVANAFGWISM